MKSIISTAILGAATLAQAASIRHGHAHVHSKRAPAAALEERAPATAFMELADSTALTSKGIKLGQNLAASAGPAPIAVGGKGPFLMELNNKGEQDIVVVVWGGHDKQTAIDACFVGAKQPNVTHTLKANTNTTISFDPSQYFGQISGALAPIYPGGGLTTFSGQVDNTWLEFTFTNQTQFSATDVSRLINMNGNKIESHNYPNKAAQTAGKPACSTTMEECSFVCTGGASTCPGGPLQNCVAGAAGNVASADGMDGGCGGLTAEGGIVEVNFF